MVNKREYAAFLQEIKQRVYRAQYDALKVVNKELISLYWDIGSSIIERQKRHGWGKSVVERLAADLQKEFPGIRGFSSQNLWYMRQFYVEYQASPILQPLVGEISWAKHLVIMSRCKKEDERAFYISMTKKFGWTKDVLIHQVENQSYEKTLLNQTSFNSTVPARVRGQARLAVKDEYTFDFLELSDEHLESELERALLVNVRRFLLEMGGHFCFVTNQHRIEVDGREYFVDLLLYHRKLKCLVALELKVGDFKPEYAGKMQFYLSAINDRDRLEDENPTIGIIICKSKSRMVVEYALKDVKKPIGISTYSLKKSLPKRLEKYLPSPKELAANLNARGNCDKA